MASAGKPGAQGVDIGTLNVQQLSAVKKQLDEEVEHLSSSFQKLQLATRKFKDCIESLKQGVNEETRAKPILVPLTASLYVPGTLADPDKVIVDVGTGFYVEKTVADAQKFYKAKVEELTANLKDLESIVQNKTNSLRTIEDVLRQKMAGEMTSSKS